MVKRKYYNHFRIKKKLKFGLTTDYLIYIDVGIHFCIMNCCLKKE